MPDDNITTDYADAWRAAAEAQRAACCQQLRDMAKRLRDSVDGEDGPSSHVTRAHAAVLCDAAIGMERAACVDVRRETRARPAPEGAAFPIAVLRPELGVQVTHQIFRPLGMWSLTWQQPLGEDGSGLAGRGA
jgi:hypothetical protein